jgi:hypothetical protein
MYKILKTSDPLETMEQHNMKTVDYVLLSLFKSDDLKIQHWTLKACLRSPYQPDPIKRLRIKVKSPY